jgi:hypothetical protein
MAHTIIYVDSGPLGGMTSSGTHHTRPKASLVGLKAEELVPGTEVRIRRGSVFNTGLTVKANGVTFRAYDIGGEREDGPVIVFPGSVTDRKNSIGLNIYGKDNVFEDISIVGAETHIHVQPGATGNVFTRPRLHDFGYGVIVKGSHTVLNDIYIERGRMVKNPLPPDKTYVGASAITLWGSPDAPLFGTRVNGGLIEQAWAAALAAVDGDGSEFEFFGNIDDTEITDVTGVGNKTLAELGAATGTKQTISRVLFKRCLTMGSGGKVMFVNDPDGDFGVDWHSIRIDECTFIADEYDESPFFFAGDHGPMARRLSVTNSIIQATSQVYNSRGDKDRLTNTDLKSITRANNVYWRTDGSKNVGVPLINGERFEDPQFKDAAARDYRQKDRYPLPGYAGALSMADAEGPSLSSETVQELRVDYSTVPRWIDMVAIPRRDRVPFMTCHVDQTGYDYRLQADKLTWLKV